MGWHGLALPSARHPGAGGGDGSDGCPRIGRSVALAQRRKGWLGACALSGESPVNWAKKGDDNWEQFRSVIRYTFWMRIHRTTRLPCILMRCSRLSPIITDSSFLIGECGSCVVYSCHMRSPVLDFVRSPRTRLRALAAEFLGWLPHSRPCEVWHAAWTIAGAACHRPQPEVR